MMYPNTLRRRVTQKKFLIVLHVELLSLVSCHGGGWLYFEGWRRAESREDTVAVAIQGVATKVWL